MLRSLFWAVLELGWLLQLSLVGGDPLGLSTRLVFVDDVGHLLFSKLFLGSCIDYLKRDLP